MNLDKLRSLVALGESETLEFKQSTAQLGPAFKTICGMLNGVSGGLVLIGVDNSGGIRGQQVSTRTHEEIAREVGKLDPRPGSLDIAGIELGNGHAVVCFSVLGGTGLYTFDGRPYQRVGPTTSVMPRETYERRILELHHATSRWENQPVSDSVTIDDLNADDIRLAVEAAIAAGRLAPPVDRAPEALLRGFGLIANDRLLNAAVALYAGSDRLRSDYPQLSIRMARFRGTDKLGDFIDNRQAWGNAFHLLSSAESFLQMHIPIAGQVVEGRRERIDRPLYTPRVLREAIANALCHRDYASAGGSLSVAMYDDRLEIANPGHLPFGLTPAALLVPHEPKPWNPLVAGVFFRAAVVESWGSGTLNMIEWSRAAGAPAPVWLESAGSVSVLLLPVVSQGQLESQPESEPESQPESEPKSLEQRVLTLLADGALSKKEISTRLGQKEVSGPLNRIVRKLVSQGRIEPTLPDKLQSRLQQYRLTESGKEAVSTLHNRETA